MRAGTFMCRFREYNCIIHDVGCRVRGKGCRSFRQGRDCMQKRNDHCPSVQENTILQQQQLLVQQGDVARSSIPLTSFQARGLSMVTQLSLFGRALRALLASVKTPLLNSDSGLTPACPR